jgi:predicted DNA-binding transcriptional regulator YafY
MPSYFRMAFFVMNRLERITTILLLLQSRKKVTAQYLANHFETSVRTIYRDVRVLEEAGVPVGAEAGIGYFLSEGYSLPPVMFTKEEAAAMITGEKLLQQFGDVSINTAFASAMHKVRAVLRSSDKDFVETLEESISVHRVRSSNLTSKDFPNRFISSIQIALVNQQVLELDYYAHHSEETTQRIVEPIGLSFLSGSWHLFAWCRLRKAVRDFRADRIKNLRMLDETYNKQKHPKLEELATLFLNPKDVQRIVIRVNNSFVKETSSTKYYLGLVEETKHDSYTEMVFYYTPIDQFARWMLMWGEHVTVVEPPALQAQLKKQITALYKHLQ